MNATVAKVNARLKELGIAERLRRGRGYYYFYGGESSRWYTSSVVIFDIRKTTVEWWIEEHARLQADC